jgi:SAM-dependent methyltransferase
MNVLLQPALPASGIGERSPFANYDRMASIYDTHFGAYSRRVIPVLEKLVLASLPQSARILDVCCGTGHLAAALSERGFVVSGVDGSAQMLRIAQRNAPRAEFLFDDVRKFRQLERFDAAVSTYDSINHILEGAELRATFENVYHALLPGGRFVFDMNMEEGYRCRWGGTLRGFDNSRPFMIRAFYSPAERLARNVVAWLGDEAEGAAEITILERCYSELEVRSALTEARFQDIEVYDGQRDLGLDGEIGRSFFSCKKSLPAILLPESGQFGIAGRLDGRIPETKPALEAGPGEPELAKQHCLAPSRQRLRGISTCIEDALWPNEPVAAEVGLMSRRLRALEEVLSTLPPEPYQLLKEEAARFNWFIPSDTMLGQVRPFRAAVDHPTEDGGSAPHARVVYLSPLLEQQEWPVIVTVVVHELAHVILGHRLHGLDREAYDHQEQVVQNAVRQWGFQLEADQADQDLKNRAISRHFPESQRGIRPADPRTIS